MNDSQWTRLTSYSQKNIAEILRSALEARGIPSVIFNAQTSTMLPYLSAIIPVDVMVHEDRLLEAQKLLKELESGSFGIDE